MISQLPKILVLIVATATPGVSAADIHVCIENGAKIIQSYPCTSIAKQIATYKSVAPIAPVPPQKGLAKPIETPSQTYSPNAPPSSTNDQPRVVYSQPSYRWANTESPAHVISPPPRQSSDMVVGGSLDGSIWPNRHGGMVHGGPLSGSIIPGNEGGMIHGGPLSGTFLPEGGGMIHGGPLSGSIMPGNQGGMIHGGPFSGTLIPPR